MPTCNICKYAGRPIYKSPCSECKGFSKYEYEKLQTNADRIRAMSDEELKDWYCKNRDCGDCDFCYSFGCTFKDWLRQPAEGE